MIEIIKHGKKKYHFICDKCGCEFTTDGAEIFSEKRLGGKQWIYCPDCGHEIIVSEYDPKVEEDLIKKEEEPNPFTNNEEADHWLDYYKKWLEEQGNKEPYQYQEYLTTTKTTGGTYDKYDCSKCPNKPDFSKGPIVGDTPCTWCPKNNPTCFTHTVDVKYDNNSWTNGIDTSTQDPNVKYELKGAADYKYGPNLNTVNFTTPEEIDYYIDTPSTYTALTSDCYKGK